MSEEPDVKSMAAILADDAARGILAETSVEPMAASDLADALDTSEPTVYRRLEDLRSRDLVAEQTQPDPEGGHHRKVYEARLRRLEVELANGTYHLDLARSESMSDTFTKLVEQI